MQLKCKRLCASAVLPAYHSEGAAAFDFHNAFNVPVTIHPGDKFVFETGVAVEVPAGYVLKLYSRSGHGFNKSIRLSNCVGIIDSDYRGEIKAALHNDGKQAVTIEPGERIIQGVLVEIGMQVDLIWIDELSETERGEKGFGSTCAK